GITWDDWQSIYNYAGQGNNPIKEQATYKLLGLAATFGHWRFIRSVMESLSNEPMKAKALSEMVRLASEFYENQALFHTSPDEAVKNTALNNMVRSASS